MSSSESLGSATLSRRRHYALWRGTARGWRAAVSAGRDAASVRSEDTLPLSVRPGKSSRAEARRERAGRRPRGEGSRGRRNGCHVARWISAPAPGPRPLPLRTPPWALQDASARATAPAGRPEPTGAGVSPAPLREVNPGPGGRRSLGPAAPEALPEACGPSLAPEGPGERLARVLSR